jgi:hypothetical protein
LDGPSSRTSTGCHGEPEFEVACFEAGDFDYVQISITSRCSTNVVVTQRVTETCAPSRNAAKIAARAHELRDHANDPCAHPAATAADSPLGPSALTAIAVRAPYEAKSDDAVE